MRQPWHCFHCYHLGMSRMSSSELELLTFLCGKNYWKSGTLLSIHIFLGHCHCRCQNHVDDNWRSLWKVPGCPGTGKPHSGHNKSPHHKCRKPWHSQSGNYEPILVAHILQYFSIPNVFYSFYDTDFIEKYPFDTDTGHYQRGQNLMSKTLL